jgi:hypothetical protein
MFITFTHLGEALKAKVISTEINPDYIVVIPQNKVDGIGCSILIYKIGTQWYGDEKLQEKFPETYSSLISALTEALCPYVY